MDAQNDSNEVPFRSCAIALQFSAHHAGEFESCDAFWRTYWSGYSQRGCIKSVQEEINKDGNKSQMEGDGLLAQGWHVGRIATFRFRRG